LALASRVLIARGMRLLLLLVVVLSGLGCGRGGLVDRPDVSQPITTTTGALTGTWALGADTIKGLPGPNDTLQTAGSPYAQLTLYADGTFDMWFGGGCVMEGTSGTWAPTTAGGLLTPQVDDWASWTDGVSAHPRPTSLNAARDGDHLRVTGVDEQGQPIDQRWRPYAP
jgi:hypothetical protein